MALTQAEKERLNDNRLKLQSVARSLRKMDPDVIPAYQEIEECLEGADANLARALRSSSRD